MFSAMVVQFRQGKQIAGKTGHDRPGLFLIEETERQGLIVGKQLIPHVPFYPCPQHMAPMIVKQGAGGLQDNQPREYQGKNQQVRISRAKARNIPRDMADAEGKNQ
jgi:hypothetical protein